ncbi:MAG: hypothetical protein AMXMBFR20_28440 [Planctomycetia bacterium]
MYEFSLKRPYRYSKQCGLAFELGLHQRALEHQLTEALVAADDLAIDRLRVQMDLLFNMIVGGQRSFPNLINIERVSLAREIYRAMRRAVRRWVGSPEHLACLKSAAEERSEFPLSPVANESPNDALRSQIMDFVYVNAPIDFENFLGEWDRPVNSLLSDLDDADAQHAHSAGREFFRLTLRSEQDPEKRADEIQPLSALRDLLAILLKYGPSEPSPGPVAIESLWEQARQLSAGKWVRQIDAQLSGAFEVPSRFGVEHELRKPYLVVDSGSGRATFLGRSINLQPHHIELLRTLWQKNVDGTVSLDDLGLDDPERFSQYMSRIRKALKRELPHCKLSDDGHTTMLSWIEELGQKKSCKAGIDARPVNNGTDARPVWLISGIPRANAVFT